MIKHLIISGGDLSVFAMLGALDILIEKYNEYDPDNIENIYSVSAGSMIGLLICLKISFKTINNYFIERPWNKLINISTQDILNIFDTRGILNVDFLYETYKPLLKICNFDETITFKQLYDYSKITLNIYSTKYSNLELHCFNHINNPNTKVIDAIFMSSTIPFIFKPLKHEGEYYIDGGYNSNFPIQYCLKNHDNKDEIFGINSINHEDPTVVSEEDNVLSFYGKLFYKLVLDRRKMNEMNNEKYKKLLLITDYFSIESFLELINNSDKRQGIINSGKNNTNTFLSYLN